MCSVHIYLHNRVIPCDSINKSLRTISFDFVFGSGFQVMSKIIQHNHWVEKQKEQDKAAIYNLTSVITKRNTAAICSRLTNA